MTLFSSERQVASVLAIAAGLLLLSTPALAQVTQDTVQTPPSETTEGAAQSSDLLSTLDEAGNFTTLVGALEATGLAEELSGSRAYTVFAPTDSAFAQLPAGTLDSLSSDQLRGVLRYHVVSERVMAGDITPGSPLTTAQDETLTFEQTGDGVTVNGTTISETDVETSNGVVHVIDGVLMPESLRASAGQMKQSSSGTATEDTTGMSPDGDYRR